jgi:hypothetical protein
MRPVRVMHVPGKTGKHGRVFETKIVVFRRCGSLSSGGNRERQKSEDAEPFHPLYDIPVSGSVVRLDAGPLTRFVGRVPDPPSVLPGATPGQSSH